MTKKKEAEPKTSKVSYAVPERPQDNIPAASPAEKPKKKSTKK